VTSADTGFIEYQPGSQLSPWIVDPGKSDPIVLIHGAAMQWDDFMTARPSICVGGEGFSKCMRTVAELIPDRRGTGL
jgi:hypothetical protein